MEGPLGAQGQWPVIARCVHGAGAGRMALGLVLEGNYALALRSVPHPAAMAGLLQPWPLLNSHHTMAQCRDLENHHHEKLLEIAISALEKMVKGELDEDLPDEVRAVSGVGAGVGGGAGARQSPVQLCGSRKPENLGPQFAHLQKAIIRPFVGWSAGEKGKQNTWWGTQWGSSTEKLIKSQLPRKRLVSKRSFLWGFWHFLGEAVKIEAKI